MEIILEKNILEKILINSQPFLEKKDFSQITAHVYIEAINNQIVVQATDYEIGIILNTSKVTIKKDGKATANGKKLLEIIKNMQSEQISLSTNDNMLIVEQENAQFKIPMFTPEEFPNFPKIKKSNQILINQLDFSKALKQALPSIDTNNPKYELNGTLLNFLDNHYDIVSTDTKRLSLIKIEENIQKVAHIIISKKSSIEIQKILHQDSQLFFDETSFIIKNENITFFTKIINSQYPDYNKIIPQDIKHTLTLEKNSILKALQMILPLSPVASIEFQKNTIKLTTSPEAQSQAKIDIKSNNSLENFIFYVNIRHILDFLSVIEEDEFLLELNEQKLPFVLSSKNYKKIIMPVII